MPFAPGPVTEMVDTALEAHAVTCAYGLISHYRSVDAIDITACEIFEAPIETRSSGYFSNAPQRIVRGEALPPWIADGLLRLVGAGDLDWRKSIIRSTLAQDVVSSIVSEFQSR
jgi:hypothetical protein